VPRASDLVIAEWVDDDGQPRATPMIELIKSSESRQPCAHRRAGALAEIGAGMRCRRSLGEIGQFGPKPAGCEDQVSERHGVTVRPVPRPAEGRKHIPDSILVRAAVPGVLLHIPA
jgi:hypothetical protein